MTVSVININPIPIAPPLPPTATPDCKLPKLVLPNPSTPPGPSCPFEVSNTPTDNVAVFRTCVVTVVENVCTDGDADSATDVPDTDRGKLASEALRKTSAIPGAGTWIVQTLLPAALAGVHVTVCTVSFCDRPPPRDLGRPSDSKLAPNVCPAQVKFPFCETVAARRYLWVNR